MTDLDIPSISEFKDLLNFKNLIFFGAPGTGKSYKLKSASEELFGKDYIERVTFHPDYSYSNFVGSYKPVMRNNSLNNDIDNIIKEIYNIDWNKVILPVKGEHGFGFKNEDGNFIELKCPNGITDKNVKEVIISVLTETKISDLIKNKIIKFIAACKNIDLKVASSILVGLLTVEEDNPFKDKEFDKIYYMNNTDAPNWSQGKILRDFVSLKKIKNFDNSEIEYKFVPGPFMRMYAEAKNHINNKYVLIIEEINRANVAAVFGDLFQLLDRKGDGSSEYPIAASEDIKKYLEEKGISESFLSFPSNFYIWATMNSADQGVFPMDTAFKRRWEFKYLGINDNDKYLEERFVTLELKNKQQTFCWNVLRKEINNYLAELNINEDKQLGPYFINVDLNDNKIEPKGFKRVFESKVLMYLFEDAARHKRDLLFQGCDQNKNKRYSDICEQFNIKGINIFNKHIVDNVKLSEKTDESNNYLVAVNNQ